ncbi:MAG TPA: asparagine synthase (glutamine-hydrolyzing) [Vicinamibacterales bacterium]|nr:asparagine synthase (glutamine-hydrolyzing) [Vicinamibacterales bacterium]
MCGIAGIVADDRLEPEDRARALRMADVIAHRGPDDAGLFVDQRAALAHRRLSIVDVAGGHQPLANETGQVWIAFNGEIYNHASIRPELEAAGHRYSTRCDTETIVHAYEQWGDACVDRFRGMFAFAIWDAPRRRLLLARDRLGVKPLYWARAGSRLLFGSEIKTILATGLVAAEANGQALPELLGTRYLSGTETLFRGIHRLMPGHTLVFEDGQVTIRQYWDVPAGRRDPEVERLSDADAVRRFRELLEESVRIRLMSDVPLGMFLSGGLDSSAIAALMARMIGRPLQTFSVAFEQRAFSELDYARQVSTAIGADAHEIVIDDQDFFGALPRLIWHEDEPVAHPSSVPLYFVSALASRHVKVVLTGEGSDELLAGYGKYPRALANWRAGAAYSAVPEALRGWVANSVVPQLPARFARYAKRSFLAMPRTPEMMFFDNFASIGLRRQAALLTGPFAAQATPERAYGASRAYFEKPNGQSTTLDRLLYTDLKTYLVELLMKQDQMSMAASIESRVPFLDHHLVEFATALRARMKLRGFTTKWILREAIRDLLPPGILTRRKMGFPVPFGLWMTHGWQGVARDVLLDRRTRERGIIDPSAVERLIAAHADGRQEGADAIWSLLNLELWYRTFIDGGGVQTLPSPLSAGARAPRAGQERASA